MVQAAEEYDSKLFLHILLRERLSIVVCQQKLPYVMGMGFSWQFCQVDPAFCWLNGVEVISYNATQRSNHS